MRTILCLMLLIGVSVAINWEDDPELREAVDETWAEFQEDWLAATADSIEWNGIMFEMPSWIRSYFQTEAIASWSAYVAAHNAFKDHATSE